MAIKLLAGLIYTVIGLDCANSGNATTRRLTQTVMGHGVYVATSQVI